MERKSYITRRFNQILKETINEKAEELMGVLKLNPPGGPADYVQEEKGMCNECGKPYTMMEGQDGEVCECGDPYSIEVKERLIGGQRKLDKNKNGRLDTEDFAMLRNRKKKEMREYTMGDDDIEGVKSYDDASTDSPNIKPGKNQVKNVGDKYQRKVSKKFDDYEMEENEQLYELEVSENFLKRIFGKKKEEETPIEEPKAKSQVAWDNYDPSDWDHNTGMPRSAMMDIDNAYRKRDEELKNIKPENNQPREKSEKEKEYEKEFERLNREYGAEAAVLGIDPREVEAMHARQSKSNELDETETDESREFAYAARMAKKKGDKTFKLGNETFDVNETYYRIKVDGEMATFSENEMIDIIEGIVKEEKDNLKRGKEPKGYAEYERVHKADKKEGDKYFKELAKKMTDYTKDMSDSETKYDMKNTKKFPTGNDDMKKTGRKKYVPSDAVDDYVDAFVKGSGMTGLVYDEIKPNDAFIQKYLKGDSSTGNAQVDKDGEPLGNVVPSKVGDQFYDLYKNNLYGQEQMNASYKRQPQDVIDVAGEETEGGSLKSKRGKKTAKSILNKLDESVSDKKIMKLNEEFSRMQELIGYTKKTQ
jgi:hypothetical protein